MNKNLPFYSCNDDELTSIISPENSYSNDLSITMTANVTNEIKLRKSLAQTMLYNQNVLQVKNNL